MTKPTKTKTRSGATLDAKFTTANDVARHLGLHNESARLLLKSLVPAYTMPYGKGIARFYDTAEVLPLVEKYKAAHLPQPQAPQAATVLDGTAAQIKGLTLKLDAVAALVDEANTRTTARMTEQNRALLLAFEKLSAKFDAMTKALGLDLPGIPPSTGLAAPTTKNGAEWHGL